MKTNFKIASMFFLFVFAACNSDGNKVVIGSKEDFAQAVINDIDYQSYVQARDQVTRMSLNNSIDPILMMKYANQCKASTKGESEYAKCLHSKGADYEKVHILREKKRRHYEAFLKKFPQYGKMDPAEKQYIYEMTPYFTEIMFDIKKLNNNKK